MSRPNFRRLAASGLSALFLALLPAVSTPSPVQIATTPVASPGWLTRFNAWRGNAAVPALTENTTWSQGDYNHAVYMVKNNLITHYETVGTPYYTPEGDTAARNSNIYVSSSTSTTDDQAIDWWMGAPFHAMGMVDPRLTTTAFGSYREVKSGWDMGAAVDVLRGNSFTGGRYPVYFPGDGSTEPLTSYSGNESPDPLQACSGYTAPTGLPVFIEVGGNVATSAGPVHSFTGNGTALAHCIIDSSSPSVGSNLTSRGGVILIPRQPLQSGVKYTVALTVNGLPYTWSFTVGVLGNSFTCATINASASPASPSMSGGQVTITAAATNCPTPRYRFWIQASDGTWRMVQDYSASNTYLWTGMGAGTYHLEVDARDSSETVNYDVVTNFNYSLNGCSSAALSASPTSPQLPGGTIILTATATCPGVPTYRFWTGRNGIWTIVQDYGISNTYSWNTTGVAPSAYGLEVDVRDQGSTDTYERVANISYVLAAPPCGLPTLNASPSGQTATAGTVALSASTSGCPTPNYRFWVGQNGVWKVVQDYSAISTFSWNTGAYAAGTYGVEVDVRDASSSVTYDRVANITYLLVGCSAARLSASQASPQAPGVTVGLTGAASCLGTPDYRFWVGQNGIWTIVQDYSPTSNFSWNTTGKLQGTYGLEVDVRNHGATATYETVANVSFTLSTPPCTAARLTTDKTSPQVHGTTVVLTGSATCSGAPEYRFWVRDLTGRWTIVKDYSSANTFSWNTTSLGPGTYGLEVDVRNQGSTTTYETVSNLTFAVS